MRQVWQSCWHHICDAPCREGYQKFDRQRLVFPANGYKTDYSGKSIIRAFDRARLEGITDPYTGRVSQGEGGGILIA